MYTNNKLAKSIRLALMFGGASVAVSGTAFAQDESEAGVEAEERIQVTGSRIKRTDYETASPVQITSAEEIKLSGFTRIEDLMNSLPQVEASETSFLANGASGVATLDLRGLGAERTLVLVNGRRLQPGNVYSQAPDINQIPTALVKRVEVLTGGGSSTYGADAVAGVVNFIMNNDFEGFEVVVGGAGYQHNNDNEYIQGLMDDAGFDYPDGQSGIGGKSFNIDVTVGSDFADGKGHATAYATWRSVDELRQEERDYSSCALNAQGTACSGSATAINPNVYFAPLLAGGTDPLAAGDDYDFGREVLWSLQPDSSFAPFDGSNVYNFAPVNHFMRPDERYTFGSFVNYEVNEYFRPYVETSFMYNRTRAQIAESGIFFQYFEFDLDNDIFSDAQRQQFLSEFGPGTEAVGAYIGKRNVEGGARVNQLESTSYRIVVGTEGYLSDTWSYDLSFQWGSTASNSVYINDLYIPRIGEVLGANGYDAYEGPAYNVFQYNGVTPEAAAPLGGTGILNGVANQRIINGYATGELDFTMPGASYPVAAVVGFENRELDFERIADEVYKLGALAGQGGPTDSLIGGYNVREVFGELQVPLVNDTDWADSLALNLGARYSDYSTTGGETTYKVELDYNPNENYKIRASLNRAIRAPNVAELFATRSIGLWQGSDPCAGDTPEYTAAQCANTGVTAAQYGNIGENPAGQYNGFFGGEPELISETADTMTLGLVGNPFENFNFSVDYWDITIEDVIGVQNPEFTLRQCAETGDAVYCDLIERPASGSLWRGTEGFVVAYNRNLAERKWRGLDVSANYEIEDVLDGSISLKMIGSYMLEKEYLPNVAQPDSAYDCAGVISTDCFAQPDWRHTFTANYVSGEDWTLSAKWRYFGGVDLEGATNTLMGDSLPSYSYLDVTGAFDLTENVSLLLGVNNILDKEPPLVGSAYATNANTVAGFYDTLGRYMHASVTFRF